MFVKFDENKHHKIVCRYGSSGRLVPSGIIQLDETMVKGTLFDPALSNKMGWIRLPIGITNRYQCRKFINLSTPVSRSQLCHAIDEHPEMTDIIKEQCYTVKGGYGIQVPIGINTLYTQTNGDTYMTDIQDAVYGVIAQCVNYANSLIYTPDNYELLDTKLANIDNAVNNYFQTIAKKIAGKHGIMRDTFYPRSGLSAYGVAANRIDCPLDSVFLPRKTLRNWLRNPEYARSINAPNEWELLPKDKFDEIFKNQSVILVGMPDHDENCVFTLKMKVWSCDAIGVNPAIAMAMGRDFDGDLLYFKAFLDPKANEEMRRFDTNAHIGAIQKALCKVYRGCGNESKTVKELERAVQLRSREVQFTSTNLSIAPDIEGVKPEANTRFQMLIRGMTDDEIMDSQASAAQDFYIIKSETASAGDIGNLLRILASKYSKHDVHLANKFYHFLAQNALDAKHNTANVSKQISNILRNADNLPANIELFYTEMKKLMPEDVHDTLDLLVKIFYSKDGYPKGSITEIYEFESRLGSIVRGNHHRLFAENTGYDSLVGFLNII